MTTAPNDMQRIQMTAAALKELNKFWRDPASRLRFETETGLKPLLTGNSLEVEAQHQSGHTERYHRSFDAWAAKQSDIFAA